MTGVEPATPRVIGIEITPVAFRDVPLLAASGMHEPWATRTILEIRCEGGIVGLSETYGDRATIEDLQAIAPRLAGMAVTRLAALKSLVESRVADSHVDAHQASVRSPRTDPLLRAARIFGAFEVGFLDAHARALSLPLCDLLGGQVRDSVAFSAYLFYKPGTHPGLDEPDPWGEVLTPQALLDETREMVRRFGFRSLKLKGGVLEPALEIETLRLLNAEFPDLPLRIDPNGNWSTATSLRVLSEVAGMLEYLEDPVIATEDMAAIQAETKVPLATNMCVTGFHEIPKAIRLNALKVILADHHFWGGLRATLDLARICETFGLGLSMHSNTHLGISLMAMVQVAAACRHLTYACDTHYSWMKEDLVEGGLIGFTNGAVAVPDGPGLGVEIDRSALARMAGDYARHSVTHRDDGKYMQKLWPGWTPHRPRF